MHRFFRHWFQRKLLVSDPGVHHGMCVTYVPWCMSGSLTFGGGENAPGIPVACATRNFAYLARGPCNKIINKRHNIYDVLRKNYSQVRIYLLCERAVRLAGALFWSSMHNDMKHYRLMKCFKGKLMKHCITKYHVWCIGRCLSLSLFDKYQSLLG